MGDSWSRWNSNSSARARAASLEHCGQPRRQLDLSHGGAGRFERAPGGLECLAGAGGQRLPRPVEGDAEHRCATLVRLPVLARDGTRPARHLGDRAREQADRVERPRERLQARRGQRAVGRLEADHAAVRGRPDDRATRLRADGERDEPCSHRGRRTRRRPARRAAGSVGVVGGRRVEEREFGGAGLADHGAPGAPDGLHDGGVAARLVAHVDRRAVRGGQRRTVEDVLHADGQALQGALAGQCAIEFALRASRVVHGHEGMQLVVAGGDGGQRGAHGVGGRAHAGRGGRTADLGRNALQTASSVSR
jgi:hypothetical protein